MRQHNWDASVTTLQERKASPDLSSDNAQEHERPTLNVLRSTDALSDRSCRRALVFVANPIVSRRMRVSTGTGTSPNGTRARRFCSTYRINHRVASELHDYTESSILIRTYGFMLTHQKLSSVESSSSALNRQSQKAGRRSAFPFSATTFLQTPC